MDAKKLVRRKTESALGTIFDYDFFDKILSDAIATLPTSITSDLNEQELLAIYMSKCDILCNDSIDIRPFADVQIRNVGHRMQRDFVRAVYHKCIMYYDQVYDLYDYYTCAYMIVCKFGFLRGKGKIELNSDKRTSVVKEKVIDFLPDEYLRSRVFCDWEFGIYELIAWGTKKYQNFYDMVSESGIKWFIGEYMTEIVDKDKINWNKPFPWINVSNFDMYSPVAYTYMKNYVAKLTRISEDADKRYIAEYLVERKSHGKFNSIRDIVSSVMAIDHSGRLDRKTLVFTAYWVLSSRYYDDWKIDQIKKRI